MKNLVSFFICFLNFPILLLFKYCIPISECKLSGYHARKIGEICFLFYTICSKEIWMSPIQSKDSFGDFTFFLLAFVWMWSIEAREILALSNVWIDSCWAVSYIGKDPFVQLLDSVHILSYLSDVIYDYIFP